jgi:oligopeptide transport system permease protein
MSYFLHKFFSLSLTFLCIATLTFFLMKWMPGDPFSEEQGLPKEIHEALNDYYGFNEPWYIQYGSYLKNLLSGDLGPSFKYPGRQVNTIITEGFPISALLGLEALCLALPLGLLLGALGALKKNQWQDIFIILFTTLVVSMPNFLIASLLQYFIALKLGWLPLARWTTFWHTLLPAFSLALLPMAFIARLTRSAISDVLQQEFIRTAQAKGLSKKQVFIYHVMRNACLPVLSYLGQLVTNIMVGSFIIEKIFSIPGLGQWFVLSIGNRDYTAIMGLTLFYSAILLIITFLVDVIYSYIDPRILSK